MVGRDPNRVAEGDAMQLLVHVQTDRQTDRQCVDGSEHRVCVAGCIAVTRVHRYVAVTAACIVLTNGS